MLCASQTSTQGLQYFYRGGDQGLSTGPSLLGNSRRHHHVECAANGAPDAVLLNPPMITGLGSQKATILMPKPKLVTTVLLLEVTYVEQLNSLIIFSFSINNKIKPGS